MAQQQKVEYFSIATELDSMAKKSNWAAFIKSAKHDYRGSLSFTINWAETAAGKVAWSGTTPGMDTYQLASLPNSATPSNLLTAWNNALSSSDTVPFSLSSATIDEVAILAQDGAYSEPVGLEPPPADQPVQREHPGELVLDGVHLLQDPRHAGDLLLGRVVRRRRERRPQDADAQPVPGDPARERRRHQGLLQ